MRILFLTQIIPYPPDSGPKVKTYHVLRYLAERGHQIFLVSFVRPEEEAHLAPLREICTQVVTVPIRRSRYQDVRYWFRSQLARRPFLIERDDLPGMRRAVSEILRTNNIDCIHADQLTMAQFGLPEQVASQTSSAFGKDRSLAKRPLLVFDAHNAVWTIVERMRQTMPFYLQPLLKIEARRVKRYEGMILQEFDHTLAVTDIDRRDLTEAWAFASDPGEMQRGKPVFTVIPIAVDTDLLQPAGRLPGSKNILTLGTLHYPPNADGIRWFIQEVFPALRAQEPDVTLTIAGKNPPQDFYLMAEKYAPSIKITGYVPDLQPLMKTSSMLVIPVRAGSGMRVRILEAFARGMPVVTTSIGLEGIDANPGEDVLVADSPQDFGQAVLEVLRDPALQARLALHGRNLAVRRYDWKVALQPLENIYAAE